MNGGQYGQAKDRQSFRIKFNESSNLRNNDQHDSVQRTVKNKLLYLE